MSKALMKIYEALKGIKTAIEDLVDIDGDWIEITESVTFSSVDDPTGIITVKKDLTGILSVGKRIKMTNNGDVIFGIITKDPSYSSPNTTITFLHEIDPADSQALYLLVDSEITNFYYSGQKVPHGFSPDPRKWSIVVVNSSDVNQVNPTQNVWYNLGGAGSQISVPIGAWKLAYQVVAYVQESSTGTALIIVTLSTANNSESESGLSAVLALTVAVTHGNIVPVITITREKNIVSTSKIIWYLNARTTQASAEDIRFRNSQGAMQIIAVCTYL